MTERGAIDAAGRGAAALQELAEAVIAAERRAWDADRRAREAERKAAEVDDLVTAAYRRGYQRGHEVGKRCQAATASPRPRLKGVLAGVGA